MAEQESVWRYRGYELETGNLVTALVHVYRAEVTRANLWRSRLDTTTNWAVATTGGALTFAFGSPNNPHYVLLLVLLLGLTFLLIEARRYRYYALWHYRIRLLETGFLSKMLVPPFEPPAGWAETLSDSLEDPAFITPVWRAVGARYRSNYVWLTTLITISWVLKLGVHPTAAGDLATVVSRAAIGDWLSGAAVLGIVATLYVGLLAVAAATALIPATRESLTTGPGARIPVPAIGASRLTEQMAIIVTDSKDAIASAIMEDLHRGVTALQGTGMFTGDPKDVLFTAVPAALEAKLRKIVETTDPSAFVIVTGIRDIRGRGFAPTEPPT